MTERQSFLAPENVYLFGAGRWARVILSVLCDNLPPTSHVTVISSGHAKLMEHWVAHEDLGDRVCVRADWPGGDLIGAAIVANAVRDHPRAARSALDRRVPVLVEKPLAATAADVAALMNFAARQQVFLGAAHVLLFAEYLGKFATVVSNHPAPTRIRIRWADGAGERRYGELKTVDTSVPVVLDVFPHIMSVLRVIWPDAVVAYESTRRGMDDAVTVELTVDGVPCAVDMARSGPSRTRWVEVATASGVLTLDFAIEPGVIGEASRQYTADDAWATRPGPLTLQLKAFLAGAVNARWDRRLSPALAYEVSNLTDPMVTDYFSRRASS